MGRIRPRISINPAQLPRGTVLRRWYRGELHVVVIGYIVRPDGRAATRVDNDRGFWRYQYRGVRYRSLSAIAAVICGDPYTSGIKFFGLRLTELVE